MTSHLMKTFTPRIDTPRTNAAVAECATPPDPHFIDFVLGLERESKAVQGQRDAFRDEVERLKTDGPQIGVHKIALRVSNLEVVAGLRERLIAAASFGSGKTGRDHLVWMCDKLLNTGVPYMPIDKSGRWIGFIQGVMAANGCLDVDAERDRTRPLYERAYMRAYFKPTAPRRG